MRLSVPLAYNFLELTRMDHAAIYVVMGPIKYVRFLGSDFNKWVFPSCLILMVLLTLFNIYGKSHFSNFLGRLLNCVGLKQYQFDSDFAQE